MKKCLLIEKLSIEWKCIYWPKRCILKNEKSQLFGVFKYIHGINLCSHVAQWGAVNKKSNVSAISYYIDILDCFRIIWNLVYKDFLIFY